MGKARSVVRSGGKALPGKWRPRSPFEPKGSKAAIRPPVLK